LTPFYALAAFLFLLLGRKLREAAAKGEDM
jgi:hypothetical protein